MIILNFDTGIEPYYARTDAEALRQVRRFQGYGYGVEYLGNGVFLVHDEACKETEVKTA